MIGCNSILLSAKGVCMDGNEFEFEDKKYQPVKTDAPCSACALCDSDGCLLAPCSGDIIFVEKQQ